jgi:hypothetical protein
MVLHVLINYHLYSKYRKCDFFQKEIQYLSHLNSEGVVVDPKNIKAIMDWTTPRNVFVLISFMGLDRYH